jgi:hypothetical protein
MIKRLTVETKLGRFARLCLCHRVIYAGLAVCHSSGCFLTGKPELYGPMAVLYAILAVKG